MTHGAQPLDSAIKPGLLRAPHRQLLSFGAAQQSWDKICTVQVEAGLNLLHTQRDLNANAVAQENVCTCQVIRKGAAAPGHVQRVRVGKRENLHAPRRQERCREVFFLSCIFNQQQLVEDGTPVAE